MENNLVQEAITAAVNGNWEEALKLNLEILKENPQDTEATNRLARAYAETGNLKKAIKMAKTVLKLDPHNQIAQRSLEKWLKLKSESIPASNAVQANFFIEEPGKTKIVPLIHLGNPKVIAKLDAGDEVKFKTYGHKISILTSENEYVGCLPDDINCRLKKLIELGNEYRAFVKTVGIKEIKIFIRETKKSAKAAKIPSFTPEKVDYVSFTPPELVHQKEDDFSSLETEDGSDYE